MSKTDPLTAVLRDHLRDREEATPIKPAPRIEQVQWFGTSGSLSSKLRGVTLVHWRIVGSGQTLCGRPVPRPGKRITPEGRVCGTCSKNAGLLA